MLDVLMLEMETGFRMARLLQGAGVGKEIVAEAARRTTKADDVRSEWMEKRLVAQHHPH